MTSTSGSRTQSAPAVRAARMTLSQAARATGGRVEGSGRTAFGRIAPVHDAGPGDLALLADRRYAGRLRDCGASAVLVSEAASGVRGGPSDRLVVPDAHQALVDLLPLLHPPGPADWVVHATAAVHPSARLLGRAAIDAHAVVGAGAEVGSDVRIGAGCVVGEGARIGEGSLLHPQVTLYPGTVLGARVIVHAGARIGADGFGYVSTNGAHAKVPQVGGCTIEDDVEIGANCTIDRGSIGHTRVGEGSKLDNLVHIGHNVDVGRRVLIVAQVGVSGSTRIGDGAVIGGQAGLVGHLRIGEGARIGAQAGVISDVEAGAAVSGYPARDHRSYLKAMARLMQLPALARRVARLERRAEQP